MNNITKLAAVAAVAAALTQTSQATTITGNIGFSGSAQLNGADVASSSYVSAWVNGNGVNDNKVGLASGDFASLIGQTVTLTSPWSFVSSNFGTFWQVGGFTFNLASSSVASNAGGFLNIVLAGTVTGNGFEATSFTGRVTIQDPSTANGNTFTYTESLSFQPVPDGGTTVLLLGSAISGLALLRRKFVA
ncbi:MAG TPA: VPDSG-CTERM sorting domain-containing protein [Verrucomicrobiae bacterium]